MLFSAPVRHRGMLRPFAKAREFSHRAIASASMTMPPKRRLHYMGERSASERWKLATHLGRAKEPEKLWR